MSCIITFFKELLKVFLRNIAAPGKSTSAGLAESKIGVRQDF
jgi:hypothetical protein